MTLRDIVEYFGIEVDYELMDQEAIDRMDVEIYIHHQPSWPLKSRIPDMLVLDDEVAFAAGIASEYGSSEA